MTKTDEEHGYLPRIGDNLLQAQLKAIGAVLIQGVKGCGKTMTARRLSASEVLLDTDFQAQAVAELDPRLILEGETPRLLDEWQRTPRLWDVVRREVDDRRKPGQFILTGSATPRDDVPRHSGAGRFGTIRMRTMTLTEKQAATPIVSLSSIINGESASPSGRCGVTLRDYAQHIVNGGWPGLIGASGGTCETFLNGYVDNMIEHDIETVTGTVRDPNLLRRFLHAYAQMTAQPATFMTILKHAQVDHDLDAPSRPAARAYVDALRRMMVIDEIPAWDPSVRSSKRLLSTEKRHLADPSLAARLLGMSAEGLLNDLETFGFLFESLVAHDVRIYAEAARSAIFHYREHDARLEVDYVIEMRDGNWIGIEVKLGAAQVDKAATSLHALAERIRRKPTALIVITAGEYAYARKDGVLVIPLGALGP